MKRPTDGSLFVLRGHLRMEVRSFHLIALFARDFLQSKRLEDDRVIGRWLLALGRIRITSWGKWSELTRQRILAEALPASDAALGRPLSESELLFLSVRVHEFVDLYAMGSLKKF